MCMGMSMTRRQTYGLEAAEKLVIEQGRVFKTLVVDLGNKQLAVAILLVSSQLSMKLFAKLSGC